MATWQPDERIAALMANDAAEAVEVTEILFGAGLDGTPASIDVLERLADRVATSERELAVRAWGAYLGEVLRRDVGGEWGAWIDGPGPAVPALRASGITVFPHDKVFKRIVSGAEHDLRAYHGAFRDRMLPG